MSKTKEYVYCHKCIYCDKEYHKHHLDHWCKRHNCVSVGYTIMCHAYKMRNRYKVAAILKGIINIILRRR